MKIEKNIYRMFITTAMLTMLLGIVLIQFPDKNSQPTNHSKSKKNYLFLWIFFTYFIWTVFLYLTEKYYSRQRAKEHTYKDCTLEFSHLNPLLKEEEQILAAFQELSDNKVLEISLFYNIGPYFRISAELNSLKRTKQSSEIIEQKENELAKFIDNFKKTPKKFFIGKGFVTFENFKRAKMFKDIYNKVYKKNILSVFDSDKKPISQKFKNAVTKTLLDKTKNTSDSQTSRNKSSTLPGILTQSLPPKSLSSEQLLKPEQRKGSGLFTTIFRVFVNKFASLDQQKVIRMPALLGEKFKLKRGIDPEMINFNFDKKNPVTWLNIVYYGVVILIVMPSLAFYFNYLFYKYEILIHLKYSHNNADKMLKYFFLIMTVVIDQVTFLLIDSFFSRQKFSKLSKRFRYTLAFHSYYILLSNIVMPNFALKKAFLDLSPMMNLIEKRGAVEHLIASLYFNYYILIFSMVNFKLIKPLLGLLKNKEGQRAAKTQNIIFGTSFIINSVFYVAFYGTITPLVFTYFFITLSVVLGFDLFSSFFPNFSRKENKQKIKENKAIEKEMNVENSSQEIEKIPISMFSTATIILTIGIFLLACLGFYGITIDVHHFLSSEEPKSHNFFASVFIFGKNMADYLQNFVLEPMSFLPPVAPATLTLIKNTIFGILIEATDKFFEDETLMFFSLSYFAFLFVFILFNYSERFLNRIQSRVWKEQKVLPAFAFQGTSYRSVNPAYKLLQK